MKRSADNRGFTLVEISIVLVIIGVLIAGVLMGKSMINNARLQSVITEVTKFANATDAFQLKYEGLPGDIRNATTIWGAADADFDTCKTTSTGTMATCDGDGDGVLGLEDPELYEKFRYWQQLANAGLVSGNFSGVATDGMDGVILGTSIPEGKKKGVGYELLWLGDNQTDNGFLFAGVYNNVFAMAGVDASSGTFGTPAFLSAEASKIDSKLDDGMPGTGGVLSTPQSSPIGGGCTTSDTYNLATYVIDEENVLCVLLMKYDPTN